MKYLNMISLKGKNVVISGACGLLGKEFCKGLAEFGANLVLADIKFDQAKEFSEELKNLYNIDVRAIKLDITSEKSVENMIEELMESNTPIHSFINSAYPRNKAYGTLFENITLDNWRENVDMHLNGYFNVTQKISKVMMKQGFGNIITMGSIYGILGPDFKIYEGTKMTMPAEYSAIKGAIVNFTKYLATYLAKYNIRVNCISPGGIFDHQPQEFMEKYNLRTPLGRMGLPEEITGGVIYLISDLSGYVTGQNLVIDGGWSIW